MELEFQSKPCSCLTAAVRQVRSAELTQEVRLTDGMPDIGRVIACWGQPLVRSKEWLSDQITVSGGVMVWILYLPEDGTQPRSMDTWIPFQLRWELDETGHDGTIRISPSLRYVDGRSLSARKMMVRASVAAIGEGLRNHSVEIYSAEEIPEDVQLLRNTYPLRLPVEAGEKTFQIDEELSVPVGAAPVERLLAYMLQPIIHEKRMAGDKLILRGSGQLHVIYRCPEGKVHALDLEVPISQYAQLDNTYSADAQADALMALTSLELDHNEQQLRLKCGMVAQYLITDRIVAELIEDAYSPRRSVQIHQEQLQIPAIMEQRTETVPIRQQLPGVDGEIVDVALWPDYPRQSKTQDQLVLELPGQFQILSYGQDGSLQSSAGHWESQMQLPADDNSRIDIFLQPGTSVQISDTPSPYFAAQYGMQLQTTTDRPMEMVTALGLSDLEEQDPAKPALILCRPGGDSLWDVAKRCGSRVCDIRQANGLDGEPDQNKILLIPVSR